MDNTHKPGQVSVDEPQHVVRTYASDMAALGQHDGRAANQPTAPAVIREDIVADAELPVSPAPAPAPAPVPAASIPVSAVAPPTDTAERASILDRLRARALSRAGAPATPAQTASRMSLGADMIGQVGEAPTTNTPPPPISLPKRPVQPPAPERTPLSIIPPQGIPPMEASSPIHTYTSDFRDRIDARSASAFSVLAAQQDAKPVLATVPKKSSARAIIFTSIGIVLVLGGIGAAVVAYSLASKPKTVAVVPGVPSLIFFDDKTEVSGSGATLLKAIAQSAIQPLPQGEVRVDYIGLATTSGSGTETIPGSGGQLIAALDLPAPDILLRNIDPASTVGIVNAGGGAAPFFLLRVTDYDATFRGMLSWESTMPQDLSVLYPAYPAPAATVATGTDATSTPVSVPAASASAAAQFTDAVVQSHDVRELKDAFGNVILLYGYADESTLIIARSEAAFTTLLGRLQSTN